MFQISCKMLARQCTRVRLVAESKQIICFKHPECLVNGNLPLANVISYSNCYIFMLLSFQSMVVTLLYFSIIHLFYFIYFLFIYLFIYAIIYFILFMYLIFYLFIHMLNTCRESLQTMCNPVNKCLKLSLTVAV